MEHFVEFEDVCKYYQTGSVKIAAADHLNFYVDKGEFCIIVGPSGAGKTTLLNEGVSTLVVQTEKGSTTLNLSLLVEGQKGTDRVVLRRLGEHTFLTVGLRCRRDLIVGR